MKAALFLLLPASVLLYFPLYLEEFENPKAYALVTFGCFAFFFVRWRQLLKDRVAQALALFLVSSVMSAILSIDWHMSVFGNVKCPMGLLVIASYLAVYLAAAQVFRREKAITQAIDIVLACSAVVALYAIAQVLGFDFKQWNGVLTTDGYTRPMSTLGHPNFMAAYLAMTIPFALYQSERSKYPIIPFLIVILSVVAIFLSLSRGMIIAAACSVAVYYYLRSANSANLVKLGLAVTAVVAISLVASPVFRNTAVGRLSNLFLDPPRKEYFSGAIRIWKRYPWFGVGTNTYELGFQHQRSQRYWRMQPAGSPHFAHNDGLTILANQGIFGALAALLLTFAAAGRIVLSRSAFRAPAVAAIASFYVAGMTSSMVVATGMIFVICLGILRNEKENS